MHYSETIQYVLSALVPYTEANLKLAFSPHRFFNDIDKLSKSRCTYSAARSAFYRMKRDGYISISRSQRLSLSAEALSLLQKYNPAMLKDGAKILVVFDIPERLRARRTALRSLLRELKFVRVQQSVWQTEFDSLDYLRQEVANLQLTKYVNIYESVQLSNRR